MQIQLSIMSLVVAVAVGTAGCQGQLAYNLPPSERLMHPGPGVGGPGPGVIPVSGAMTGAGMGAAMGYPAGAGPMGCPPMVASGGPQGGGPIQQCSYDCPCGGGPGCGPGGMVAARIGTSQVAFLGEEGIQVQWDVSGGGMFDSVPLVMPGRQDFLQASIYRLRISNIPGRPGVQLYPTLEIAPVTPRTDAYLAHAPVPVQFTEEDFDQVLSGNFVTKVMYLPDPEFQELALAGVETLVSARLDPGVDPIAEADRRGSILAILRIGNKDLESRTRGVYGNYRSPDTVVHPAQFSFDLTAQGEPEILEPLPGGEVEAGDAYYGDGQEVYGGEVYEGEVYEGEMLPPAHGGGYVMGGMPMGVQTAAFAPAAVPPHQIPSYGPQYGMPITGTPIGLPGPPHIPLGTPAGLQEHVMKNRTRFALPPPTEKFQISVKQRPGMNYPKPVQNVTVDETVRQPFSFGGLRNLFSRDCQ